MGNAEGIGNAENAEDAERQEIVIALRVLLAALNSACDGDDEIAGRLILPLIRKKGAIPEAIRAIAPAQIFELPGGARGPAAIFSSSGLLPATVMGLDIVRLLEGAAAMNERFRTAPIGVNPPLDFAGIGELMRKRADGFTPRFAGQSRGAAAVAEWCEQLRGAELSELKSEISHLKSELSDFKSQIGDLQINIVAESIRRDRITIEPAASAADPLAYLAGKSLPELSADAIGAAKSADIAAARPSVDFRLPALDEFSLGQLFQALIIATVLEARYNSA